MDIIEAYPDDKYLPSFLLRGETHGAVFHAQIATDVEGDNIRVVTMYTPDADEWDEESRKRKKRLPSYIDTTPIPDRMHVDDRLTTTFYPRLRRAPDPVTRSK